MSIMLTAIRVDRLEGFSETMLIAHDTETGVMVARNLETERGPESAWRKIPSVPSQWIKTGEETGYFTVAAPRISTYTHGSNEDCPEVQSGEWTRCLGHPESRSDALDRAHFDAGVRKVESARALSVNREISSADAARLREIATVLQDICPEEMTDEGVWLMKWVNERSPLPPVDFSTRPQPQYDNAFAARCGRPAGHDGDCLPYATAEDDAVMSDMPEKGGRAQLCEKPLDNRRTLESDLREDRS